MGAVMLVCAALERFRLLDLQHSNSSTSPKINKNKWLFSCEKNRVNILVT